MTTTGRITAGRSTYRHACGQAAWVTVCAAVLIASTTTAGDAAPASQPAGPTAPAVGHAPDAREFEGRVRPFLAAHCLKCHGGDKPKGDVRLDDLTHDFSTAASRERWMAVVAQVRSGEMPPESKPRPPAADVRAVSEWATARAGAAAAAERAAQGRVVLRRLNRVEYENTVRDLLGIDAELREMLPADTPAHGFDNVGEALHTSSFLMEQYLAAADAALGVAIANRPRPPAATKRLTLKNSLRVKASTERVYRHSAGDDTVVMFTSAAWQSVDLPQFYPPERGRYRFRLNVSGVQSAGKPVVFRVWAGHGGPARVKGHLVSYFDAPPDRPTVIEFEDTIEAQTTVSILPYGLANSQIVHKAGADNYDGPGLAVHWVEVEGPLNETWPPVSHRRVFGDLPQAPAPEPNRRDRVEIVSHDPAADARRVLRGFARRAFRRDVADDELRPFLRVVETKLAQGRSFEQALRAGLLGVMVSPKFLFLRENPGRLDDSALASRLSYFLWSTMPDEELLALAARGELGRPDVLRGQVERLLASPRAAAFAANFAGQWLGLRDIDFTVPGHVLYPEYDDMLKVSMVREAELFFAEVLRDDLSVTNFVASDFTMLNGRLARHYGIPGVDGWAFRRVPLPPGSHRGGVLTMAAVLKVTANGTSTSPVVRGAWVLDRILGTPPPRPPADVPAVEPDIRGATTIREQLAKHRDVPACAGCHAKIDPPGFALESFDVIGGWRERYRTTGNGKPVIVDGRRMPYLAGPKVDPSGTTPDGRPFRDVDEFKQLLLADRDQVARGLTEKLLTYATGGPPEAVDRPRVDAIVRRARDKGYGLRTLVHEIVQSELFRTK